jgi:phage baseplate assembly protein W
MWDIQYISQCDHKIQDELLSITGTYPNFVAYTKYPIIDLKSKTFIRSYNKQQEYISSLNEYTQDMNYSHTQLAGVKEQVLPVAGIIKKIGITNYRIEGTNKIVFGVTTPTPTENFIDLTSGLLPANKYLINYYTDPKLCPRCSGSGIVKDISFGSSGNVYRVYGKNKVVQRVLKTLSTGYGESPEDVNFGSSLNSLIGSDFDESVLITVQKYITDSVNYLISLQNGMSLTAEETITGVSSIAFDIPKSAPNKLQIRIKVTIATGETIPMQMFLNLDKAGTI